MDCERQICTHILRDFDWNVIQQSAISVDGILCPNRRENSRQRHGGAQSQGQGSTPEYLGLAAYQIGGNAGKRNRKVVEALDLGIRQCDLVQDQRNLLAGIKAFRKLQSFTYTEFETVGIIARILLAAK